LNVQNVHVTALMNWGHTHASMPVITFWCVYVSYANKVGKGHCTLVCAYFTVYLVFT